MRKTLHYAFLFHVWILVTHGIEIIKAPENVVLFTDSEAVFTCHASGAQVLSWKVNGISVLNTDFSSETSGQNTSITIPAALENNGTLIQCIARVHGKPFIESENATLLIQGSLALVSDVCVESSHDSILLSWSPPFSLDVTEVDPDIWYTVLISNVTDEDNPTVVPCTDCHNLTQPHYTFTTANSSPCHKYSFTIIPQNGAGEGSRSEPVEGAFVGNLFDVSEVKSVVKYISEIIFTVSLDLQLVGICSNKSVLYIENETIFYITEPLPLLFGTRLEFTVSTVASGLEYNSKYQMVIEGGHGSERFNASKTFMLSTFDVQKVETVIRNKTIIIMGEFIVNSPAQGCLFIVKCNSSSPDQLMAVLNTSSPAVVTGLEPNTYDILVYDVEDTGLPNEKPAVEIEDWRVTQEGSMPANEKSLVLVNVTIHSDGHQVNITCLFRNDSSPSQKCVIVCRKSTESVLMVKSYSVNTSFPVVLNISEEGNYIVAVFGWSNGVIEPFPVQLQQVHVAQGVVATSTPTLTPMSDTLRNVLILMFTLAVVLGIGVAIVVVTFVIMRRRKIDGCKRGKGRIHTDVMMDSFPSTTQPRSADTTTSFENECLLTNETTENIIVERSENQSDGVDEEEREVVNTGQMERKFLEPISTTERIQCATVPATSAEKTPLADSSVQFQKMERDTTKAQAGNLQYEHEGVKLLQQPVTEHLPTHYAAGGHPHPVECGSSLSTGDKSEEAAIDTPTRSDVVFILRPLAKKWKEIGEILKLGDDFLGEIHTNMTTDEDCLEEAMGYWMKYHEPSWKKLATALTEIGEDDTALKCHKKAHISHGPSTMMIERTTNDAPPVPLETPVGSLPQPPGSNTAILETVPFPGDSQQIVAPSVSPPGANASNENIAAPNIMMQPAEMPEPQVPHTLISAEDNYTANVKNSEKSLHKGSPHVSSAKNHGFMSDSLVTTSNGRQYMRQQSSSALHRNGQSSEDNHKEVLASNTLHPSCGHAEEQQTPDMVTLDLGGESTDDSYA